MRIISTIITFILGMMAVGFIRMATNGADVGFLGGVIIGIIQFGLFFGVPYMTWKIMAPKKTAQQLSNE